MFWLSRIVLGAISIILVATSGSMLASVIGDAEADMYLSPSSGTFKIGEPIVISLRVKSEVPTNVFAGSLKFNPEYLMVDKIDYNTSVADLWAIEPWFQNGDGTLQFAGGSTESSGFVGDEQLLQITFKTIAKGETTLELIDASILKHDGLGSEVNVVEHPIDALFSLGMEKLEPEIVFWQDWEGGTIAVEPEKPLTDLNNDGKQTVADVSIFMIDLVKKNLRSDFNQDGLVDTKDLSIILNK
jgi:hypothetical protein